METREGDLYTHSWRRGGGWEEILVRGGRGRGGRKGGKKKGGSGIGESVGGRMGGGLGGGGLGGGGLGGGGWGGGGGDWEGGWGGRTGREDGNKIHVALCWVSECFFSLSRSTTSDMAAHLLECTGDSLDTRMDECCRILHTSSENPDMRR